MTKRFAQVLGVIVAILAVLGLTSGDGQLWGMFNIDPAFDIVRIAVAAVLLYAGFGTRNPDNIHNIVMTVSVLYVGMGVLGLVSPTLFGLVPNSLTGMDIAFHLVTGLVGMAASMASHATYRHTAMR